MGHRILHISDLHFENHTRAATALRQLEVDVKREMGIETVDLIVVSGDSSERAQPDEYNHAEYFITNLATGWACPRSTCWSSPGTTMWTGARPWRRTR